MTGQNKYIAGVDNRVGEIYKFPFGINTSYLSDLKHWIADHGRGESTGGLAVIGLYIDYLTFGIVQQPGGPFHNNKFLKLNNGTTGPHAFTIVGYDDNVPISETEFGAFKIANSWSEDWGDEGFVWLPYSVLIRSNLSLAKDYAYTCYVYPTEDNPLNEPGIAIAVNVVHDNRSDLMYYVAHDEIIDPDPELPETQELFEAFTTNGGINDMRGVYYSNLPIDLAFNFSHFYQDDWINPFQKIFFNLNGIEGCQTGNINSVKLIDKRWNEVFEIPFHEIDNSIGEGDNWSYVEYYLLTRPEHNFITGVTNLNTNRISRFYTEVRAQSVVTLYPGKEIHLYNSEIQINNNAIITLQEGAKIIAKRGLCKLNVLGSLNTQDNVEFIAEEDAVLEIHLNG